MNNVSNILDPQGNPIVKKSLTEEIAEAQLTGVRSLWNHQSIARYLTPQHLDRVLQAAEDGFDCHDFLTLAEEMEERDLHYGSVLRTRKLAISGIEPTVESASDDKHDQELTEAVRQLVNASEFADAVDGSLDALGKGYAATRIDWETSSRQWMPVNYEWIDPRFFKFDRRTGRELLLITDNNPTEGEPLPDYRFIVHMPKIKCGIPVRGALARMASIAYMLKSFAMSDWMNFAEIFGMPIMVGKYGNTATPEEKNTLRRAIMNIGSDARAIMPESMKFELVERAASNNGDKLYQGLCEFLDKQVSKGVLGQTMTTEDGSSQSQAQVHNEVRLELVKADVRQLERTINRDLIRPFIAFNYGPQQRYPQVRFQVDEPEDIKTKSEALAKLLPQGLQVSADEVRDKLGFRKPQDGEEILGGTLPTAQGASTPEQKSGSATVALNRQQEVEALIDDELDDWEPQLQPEFDAIEAVINRTNSAEELAQLLPSLLQGDNTVLIDALATALFKARGEGNARETA